MIKLIILITTYNRPQMLLNLLKDIKKQSVGYEIQLIIFNDGSQEDYSKTEIYLNKNFPDAVYHRFPENYGKARYWERINQMYRLVHSYKWDYALQLPDDVRLVNDFFKRSIDYFTAIPIERRICLNLAKEAMRDTTGWTIIKTTEVTFRNRIMLRTGWVDMCFIAGRKFFEIIGYKIDPVNKQWAQAKGKSSGVGMQISKKAVKAGHCFYQVKYSLVIAGDHPSVMHPEHRKERPLISNHIMLHKLEYNHTQLKLSSHEDHIGNVIKRSGQFYEQEMLEFIYKNIPKTGTYIDAGANIGNHSLFFALFCTRHVIALEPVKQNFDLLKKNIVENDLQERIKALPLAAATTDNQFFHSDIHPDNMGMCRMAPGGDIRSTRIDNLKFQSNVTLIKIDCEGMEYDVLLGSMATIRRHRPAIFIEAATERERLNIDQLLLPLGYVREKQFNKTPTFFYKYMQKKELIFASMASFPPRINAMREAVASLLPQVDRIFIYLNDYDTVPEFLVNDKITVTLGKDSYGDLGDVGKFVLPEKVQGIHFVCDDDLIYAPNYVQHMIAALEKLYRKAMVSLQGRIFRKFPIANYYHADVHYFRAKEAVNDTRPIHNPCCCVIAYHTDLIEFSVHDFERRNMTDVYVGVICQQKQIPIYVVVHSRGMVKDSMAYDQKVCIYHACKNDDKPQTDLMNSIEWKLNQV